MKKIFIPRFCILGLLFACLPLVVSAQAVSNDATTTTVAAQPIQNTNAKVYNVPEYNKISVKGNFVVRFVYSDEFKVSVIAADYPLDAIKVKGSKLFKKLSVSYSKGTSISKANEIIFYGKHFLGINIDGDCDLSASQQLAEKNINIAYNGDADINLSVSADNFTLYQKGSGKVVISGSAKSANLKVDGRGSIYAVDNFVGSKVNATLNGSGSIQVKPTTKLNAKIDGSGMILYYGDISNVASSIKGSGKIAKGE